MKTFFLTIAAILAITTVTAAAQVRLPPPAITGDLAKDIATDKANLRTPAAAPGSAVVKNNINEIWTKIQTASLTDLQYAKALADASKTDGAAMRSGCWAAWITLIQAQQGVNAVGPDGKPLGARPDPSLFTTFEQLAQQVDSLQPTSPFMRACQPVANAFKMDILQLVTSVVGGAASLSTLGVGIP